MSNRVSDRLRQAVVTAIVVGGLIAACAQAQTPPGDPPGDGNKTPCPQACSGLKLEKPYCQNAVCLSDAGSGQ